MFRSGYIAILGAPNAGKSTLLNAILGEKIAAVTNKPQTTRRRLVGIHTEKDFQMIFLDIPGAHESEKSLNQFMMTEVSQALRDADILVCLLSLDMNLSSQVASLARDFGKNKPVLVVINKSDLPDEKRVLSPVNVERTFTGFPIFSISALTREGVEPLLEKLAKLLPEGPVYYPGDDLTDSHLRDLAAEMIREKATELTFEEIPYSLAVEIDTFKEEEKITRIQAILVVERDSQKGMVIGKGGTMIREIGTKARQDLERLMDTKVFLELKVKVDKNWTKNPDKLARYGYSQKGR